MKKFNTKYEIRSSKVQEVLNKPPKGFSFWGNTLILLVMSLAFLFCTKIKVANYVEAPVKIEYINSTSGMMTILSNNALILDMLKRKNFKGLKVVVDRQGTLNQYNIKSYQPGMENGRFVFNYPVGFFKPNLINYATVAVVTDTISFSRKFIDGFRF